MIWGIILLLGKADELGATIRDLRKKQNMTQKALAKALDVSEATICKYENNTSVPPFETLRTLAVIFNISMDTLCGIAHKGSVSVHGLSEPQKLIIQNLIDDFRNHNFITKKDLSVEQCALLGQIVAELLK